MKDLPVKSRTRWHLLGVLTLAMLPKTAAGEINELHNSPAGLMSYGATVSSTGGYTTSVPLSFPAPRGDMQVPVSVSYSGTRRPGTVGVGWDIGVSYVRVYNNLSGRKPGVTANGNSSTVDSTKRIVLNLGGRAMTMVPTGEAGHYRPAIAGEHIDMWGGLGSPGSWLVWDAAGRQYGFSKPEGLNDETLFLLTHVNDSAGPKNWMHLRYWVDESTSPKPWLFGLPSLLQKLQGIRLRDISYGHSVPFGTPCFKHRIEFDYNLDRDTEDPLWQRPLSFSIDAGHVYVRKHTLAAIKVWSHRSPACSETADDLAYSYKFEYQDDPDTGLPRLASVDRLAAGVFPGSGGERLPIARYEYASATDDNTLAYADAGLIDSPASLEELWGISSLVLVGSQTTWTATQDQKRLSDVDGDYLPDFIYPNSNRQQEFARNFLSATLPTFVPINEFTDQDQVPSGRTDQDVLTQYGVNYRTSWTYDMLVDWNGDGRVDKVMVFGGKNPDGQPDPNYWRVLLNMPTNAQTHKIEWIEVHVDISALRTAVVDAGHTVATYLALERSPIVNTAYTHQCRTYEPGGGGWERRSCATPEDYTDFSTLTDWTLKDVNGDGLPDFVFNSTAVVNEIDGCAASCPAFVATRSEIPAGCDGSCISANWKDVPASNEIHVIYNDGHGLLGGTDNRFLTWKPGAAAVLRSAGACGVERYRKNTEILSDGRSKKTQHLLCGFREVNGDGILDYIDNNRNSRQQATDDLALIGIGIPQSVAETESEFSFGGLSGALYYLLVERSRTIALPGPVDVSLNTAITDCVAGARFEMRQFSALRDLTGDGIPDYIFFGTWAAGASGPLISVMTPFRSESQGDGGTWWVMVGTGTEFRNPVAIETPEAMFFELFVSEERCASTFSNQSAGLLDVDGDGFLDLVSADLSGNIRVGKLVGSTGRIGDPSVGRLIKVDNGYGASTLIEYGNAKTDSSTLHDLPFPEIVVTKTTEVAEKHLMMTLEPTLYAYGDAQRYYDPLAARWVFAGYGRTVVMRGQSSGFFPGTTAALGFTGTAIVRDMIRPRELDSFSYYKRMNFVGRTRDVYALSGSMSSDPRSLLAADMETHPQVERHTHVDYQAARFSRDPAPVSDAEECEEITPFAAVPKLAGSAFCRDSGVVAVRESTEWEGSRSGPGKYVERRTTKFLDTLGRVWLVNMENDTSRPQDDVCLTLTYATPVPFGTGQISHVNKAVHTETYHNCGGGKGGPGPLILSRTENIYDDLPPGQVSRGFRTRRVSDRYRIDQNGEKLSTLVREFQRDAYGNSTQIVSYRANGTTTATITYDADFALLPETVTVVASDVDTAMVTVRSFDPVSLLPTASIDANGVRRSQTYDGFGRPLASTLRDGGQEYLLKEFEYLGDDPADPLGRRLVARTNEVWAPTMSSGAATRETVEFLDEYGRSRFVETPLGTDYAAGAKLITGFSRYDALGRVIFAADPFVEGQDPNSVYGTSYSFYVDNRLKCAVKGTGFDASPVSIGFLAHYPICYEYDYEDRTQVITTRGPRELEISGAAVGARDVAVLDALGQRLVVERYMNAERIEHMQFEYDRVGHISTIARSATPASASDQVVWNMVYDSAGNVVERQEPGSTPVALKYDASWNLLSEEWLDKPPPPSLFGDSLRKTVYQYDGFGRLKKRVLSTEQIDDVDSTTIDETLEYFYDTPSGNLHQRSADHLIGRLSHTFDGSMESFFSYDALGQATSVARIHLDDPEVRRVAVDNTFGPTGRLDALSFVVAGYAGSPETVETASYGYDSAGRNKSVTWSDALETGRSLFDALVIDEYGRYRAVQLGNGVTEEYVYRDDQRQELQSTIVTTADDVRTRAYLGYDGIGQLTRQTDLVGPAEVFPKWTFFQYDELNRLSWSMSTRNFIAKIEEETFSYDALGNLRNIVDGVGSNTWALHVDVQDPDRICNAQPPCPGPSPCLDPLECSFKYDAAGNTVGAPNLAGGYRTLSYDSQSRVIGISNGTATATFSYDASGNVSKLDINGGNAVEQRRDRRYGALVERVSRPDDVFLRRIPGPMGMLASVRGFDAAMTTVYEHSDFRGNQFFTGDAGNVEQDVKYRAFGAITSDTGDKTSVTYSKNLWNFGDTLPQFGITHLGARLYDPALGRFLQRDPLIAVDGSAAAAHPYSFALNDPINFADPLGLSATCDSFNPSCGDTVAWWDSGDTWDAIKNFSGFNDTKDLGVHTATSGRADAAQVWRDVVTPVEFFVANAPEIAVEIFRPDEFDYVMYSLFAADGLLLYGDAIGTAGLVGNRLRRIFKLLRFGLKKSDEVIDLGVRGGRHIDDVSDARRWGGRSLGAAAKDGFINWSSKSRKTFGHTFSRHGAGAKNTRGLTGRAASTGQAQGQWLDNEAAADFLARQRPYLQGPASVRLPSGVNAQVILPNGSIVPATRATLIPSRSGGYVSAFPRP